MISQAKNTVTELDMRGYRFGFVLFTVTQIVPIFLMFTVRYELASSYVPSDLNQLLGAGLAVVVAISFILSSQGIKAIRNGDAERMIAKHRATITLGLLAIVGTGYIWAFHSFPAGSHYGESFYSATGVAAFYVLVGMVMHLASVMRSRRVGVSAEDYWHAQAAHYFWTFVAGAWVATFIVLYWL